MLKSHILPTVIASIIGISGIFLLLFAWHLPPFSSAEPSTENAYIRGKVTSLAPQLSGYLSDVSVVDFQQVKKGDPIAHIDDRIFRQKLAQAEAKLSEAKANLEVARQSVRSAKAQTRSSQASLGAAYSSYEKEKANRDRIVKLHKKGVSSQSAVDDAELAFSQAEASVTQAKAALDVQNEFLNSAQIQIAVKEADIAIAQAAVELAQIDLDNTIIRSPADGRLGQISAHVGQYVTPGTALVSHIGKDVWIIANFKETALHGLRLDQKVVFTVDALGGRSFNGHVKAYSPATASEFSLLAGSNATGNFTKIAQRLPIRISIDPDQEMDQYLLPGFSVIVTVDTEGLSSQ